MDSGSCAICTICPCRSGRNDEVQHSIAFRSGVGNAGICPRCTCGSRSNLNSSSRAIRTICPCRSGRNDKVQHNIAFRSGVGNAGIRSRCTCSGCANLNSGSRAVRTSCTISPRCSGRNDKVQHSVAFRSGVGNAGICSRCTCSGCSNLNSGSRAVCTSCTISPICPSRSGRNDKVQHGVAFRSGVGNAGICPRCTCSGCANLNSGSRAIRTSYTICPRCSGRNDKVQHSVAFRSGVGNACICSRCTCSGRADLDSGSCAICTICPCRSGRNDEVQHSIAFRSGVGNACIRSRCTRGSRADLNSGSHTSCTGCPCRTRCSDRSRYTRWPLKTTRWHWWWRWAAATVRIFRIITCHKVFPLFVFLAILFV